MYKPRVHDYSSGTVMVEDIPSLNQCHLSHTFWERLQYCWHIWNKILSHYSNQLNSTIFSCLSYTRIWISNTICHDLFVFNGLRSELGVVRFFDIDGIADHHCFNFLFIKYVPEHLTSSTVFSGICVVDRLFVISPSSFGQCTNVVLRLSFFDLQILNTSSKFSSKSLLCWWN